MANILYKYLDLNGAKCMIGNHNLQFTNATQLNDPFDCHPRLIDYSNVPSSDLNERIWQEWQKAIAENDAKNLRDDTWLCSLSKVNDSLLMWSHYCKSHTGICIGLNMEKVKESVPGMFGVIYLEPLVIEVRYQDLIERPKANRASADKIKYQWQTKAKEWEYEQEVRLVMPKPSAQYHVQVSKQSEKWSETRVYMPLKGECFDSLYFGVCIDPKEKDSVIQKARKLNPQIKLYQMRVDENAFRLKPEEIK